MLKKKRQHKYLAKRWHSIRYHLNGFAETRNLEMLHKIRVEIKKIRAFERFAVVRGGAEMERVKKMFRNAGMIREAGLTLSLMKEFNVTDPAFKSEKTGFLQQRSNVFQSYTTRFMQQIEQADRLFRKTLHSIRNKDIRQWFTRQLGKAAGLVAVSSTSQFHAARKKIKTLLYVHGILPKKLAGSLHLNTTYIDQLQDTIGKWHDVAMAVKLLISHRRTDKVEITQLREQQETLAQEIHTMADDFLQKAAG